jgi:MtN3 and saliva related transmembrane protein
MSIPISYIGIAAGIFTGVSMLPQLVKIIKEKNAEGVSPVMLTVLIIGLALWVWYGARREDWPIIITNAFSLVVNTAILVLKAVYRGRQKDT